MITKLIQVNYLHFHLTSFLHQQIVDQESDDQGDGQFAKNECLDGLDSDEGDEDWHQRLHLQLEQEKNWQQQLLLQDATS